MAVTVKSAKEIELMREAGRRLEIVHDEMAKIIRPGISTMEINEKGDKVIRELGCKPNFLHYGGFPASICVSVNEEVVHGIPKRDRILKEGDIVKKINHSNIHVAREVTNYVTFHQKQSVTMTVERDGKDITVQMDPVANESGRYIFGISCSSNYREKCGILGTLKYSAYEVKYWIQLTIESIKMLFTGQASINDMSGPVGVVSYIGETYQESQSSGGFYVWLNMLNISILLTANLGVMNLLPIPALDGGRLVFLIIELIRGKRIDPEKEGMVHFVGLMLLMLLMVVVMFNDVRKIFF